MRQCVADIIIVTCPSFCPCTFVLLRAVVRQQAHVNVDLCRLPLCIRQQAARYK